MRRTILALAFAGLVLPALGAELKTCAIWDGSNPRQQAGTKSIVRVQIEGDTVVMVTTTTNGHIIASDFTPVKRGLSQRSVLSHDPTGWRSTFNIATVEPDGEVRINTWVREEARLSEGPVYIWMRLRC